MLKTLQIKLLPDDNQKNILLSTFKKFNEACNFVSKIAWDNKIYNKIFLQRLVYYDIRNKFGLSAQLTIRVIAKVVDTYLTDRSVFHEFREYGSIVYDQRVMSFKSMDEVSLNTIKGRIRIPITIGKYGEIPFNRMRGQCDLVRRHQLFYLMVSVDVPEQPVIEPKNVIGVDMGIANISVDSTGKYYSGEKVKEVREHNLDLRSRLQSVNTKSAKRHLKKLSGKVTLAPYHIKGYISIFSNGYRYFYSSLNGVKAYFIHAFKTHYSLVIYNASIFTELMEY